MASGLAANAMAVTVLIAPRTATFALARGSTEDSVTANALYIASKTKTFIASELRWRLKAVIALRYAALVAMLNKRSDRPIWSPIKYENHVPTSVSSAMARNGVMDRPSVDLLRRIASTSGAPENVSTIDETMHDARNSVSGTLDVDAMS